MSISSLPEVISMIQTLSADAQASMSMVQTLTGFLQTQQSAGQGSLSPEQLAAVATMESGMRQRLLQQLTVALT